MSGRYFGEALPNLIRLVSGDHEFPYLIEQEERWHGALLASTSHGALTRVLQSFSDVPGPYALVQFCPDIDALPPHLDTHLKYAAAKLIDNGRDCHEAFARYVAYQKYVQRIGPAPSLRAHFEKAARRFPLLQRLQEVLGDVLDPGCVRPGVAYLIAKLALSTNELWTLLAKEDPRELARALAEATFFDSQRPDVRANLVLDRLQQSDLMSDWARLSSSPASDPHGILQSEFDFALQEIAKSAFAEQQTSMMPLRSAAYLSTRAILLGKRIEMICQKQFHGLESGHIALRLSTKGKVDLDERFYTPDGEPHATLQSIRAVIDNDPSLTVWYEPRFDPEKTLVQDAPDVTKERLPATGRCLVYFVPTGGEDACCLLVAGEPATAAGYVVNFPSMKDLFAFLADLKHLRLTFLLLPPVFQMATINVDPREILHKWLSPFGDVVFWRLTGKTSNALFTETIIYLPPSAKKTLPGNANSGEIVDAAWHATTSLGLFEVNNGYCSIASVPSYVVKILEVRYRPLLHRVLDEDAPPIFYLACAGKALALAGASQPSISNDLIHASAYAFDVIYAFRVLPEPLPYFDPWAVFHELENYFSQENRGQV